MTAGTIRVGDPVYRGSPSFQGVYVVRMRYASAEAFSFYDGTRFSLPQPTAKLADAEMLVEGRLPAPRTVRREDVEYWRTHEVTPDAPPPPPPGGWMAMWRAAVNRLLGRA